MFDNDAKIIESMAPYLRRVLIADPQAANARMLGELLRGAVGSQVWAAPTTEKALKLAGSVKPDIVFVEMVAEGLDGMAFTRRLRRSRMPCRTAPVIMLTGTATAAAILAARDAGVHEFLSRPFTLKDLLRRLEAVTLRPRDWIEAVDYVGPDRRRFNSGDYKGPLKRRTDKPAAQSAQASQALKILRSAIAGLEKDPAQALRALLAQAQTLQQAGAKARDIRMTTAAVELVQYLQEVERTGGRLHRAEVERLAQPLLLHLPKDEAA